MNTFSTADHPRVDDGTFTDKPQSAPELTLAAVGRTGSGSGEEVLVDGRLGRIIGEDNGTFHILYGNGDQSLELERTLVKVETSEEDAATRRVIEESISAIHARASNLTGAEASALISVERQINDGAWGDIHEDFLVGKIDAEIHGLHDKWLLEKLEPLDGLAREGDSDDILDGRAIARDTAAALALRPLIGNLITPGITQEAYDHETRAWRERFGAIHPDDEVRPASWSRRPLDSHWVRNQD